MRKKILAARLTVTMALGMLAGCGGGSSSGGSASGGETKTDDGSKEVNLVMYVVSDRPGHRWPSERYH